MSHYFGCCPKCGAPFVDGDKCDCVAPTPAPSGEAVTYQHEHFTCTVCKWPWLHEDPKNGNYNICPRCSAEFGYDDKMLKWDGVFWSTLDLATLDAILRSRPCAQELLARIHAWGDRCRREALRAAAKATCDYCRIDGDPEDFINHPDPSGDGGLRWIHTGLDDGNSECMAQEIWNCISSAKWAALTPPAEPKESKP